MKMINNLKTLAALNPQKFTVNDIAALLKVWKWEATIILDIGVRQGELERFEENGTTFYKVSGLMEKPEMIFKAPELEWVDGEWLSTAVSPFGRYQVHTPETDVWHWRFIEADKSKPYNPWNTCSSREHGKGLCRKDYHANLINAGFVAVEPLSED